MLTLLPDLPVKPPETLAGTSRPSYDELRVQGSRAVDTGDFDAALAYYRESLELARAAGDGRLIDLATCNSGAVLITLGRQREVVAQLREILMANRCPENSCLAAYHLSRAHARSKAAKKGLFYAQIACDRALAVARDKWLLSSYNQLGNCLVDESRFDEAVKAYRRALTFQPEEPSVLRAQVLVNLGYCWIVQGKIRKGLTLTFRALRWLRRFGAYAYEAVPHLDLCYAYIELGRYHRARRHGLRGLAIAEDCGEVDRVKIALYLLGETESAAGQYEEAYDYFSRLQQRFYPESPQLRELMVFVDMRQMVNLRA
jgi:tetratricopeptide (TPR) repeat protein